MLQTEFLNIFDFEKDSSVGATDITDFKNYFMCYDKISVNIW